MADNSRLTFNELDNIFKTYEQYGAEHLGAFIQAVWKEAYELGREDGARNQRIYAPPQ